MGIQQKKQSGGVRKIRHIERNIGPQVPPTEKSIETSNAFRFLFKLAFFCLLQIFLHSPQASDVFSECRTILLRDIGKMLGVLLWAVEV